MNHFSEEELLDLNRMGLIPGPQEDELAFAERVKYTLHLADHLPAELSQVLSDSTQDLKEARDNMDSVLSPSLESLKKRYDSAPQWVQVFFSNYKLPFWQGGCAWIFQMTEESPTSALIQLRQVFKRSRKYLGFYDREELLTHELVHVGRMMFQEPKFEEVLAYRTATSSYRRYWGPFIQSSMESSLFLLLLFIVLVFDVFLVALGHPDAYFTAIWLKLVPLCVILAGGIRLWKRQKTLSRCLDRLKQCVKEGYEEAVIYRLRDEEICLFSQMLPEDIQANAKKQADQELRWRVIQRAYFSV